MISEELRTRVADAQLRLSSEMEYVNDFIYKNPELGMEEYLAVDLLCDITQRHGFSVTVPFCDMDTAFIAEFKNGPGPVIAFLAEYDAAPGFGPNNGPGHGNGHNWTSAVTLGAALVLKELGDCFQGTVRLIGTPGMENFSGKVDMVKRRGFDGIDVAMQSQLEQFNCIEYRTLAMDAIEFRFRGRAAHATVQPELGINALDAAQFTFVGLNALKNYLRKDVSIHGIITEGGKIPNMIPESAACQFYVRALDREHLDQVTKRVIRCAEGAALMAGAEMSYRFFEGSCDNLVNNRILQELLLTYWEREGIVPNLVYTDETATASGDIGNVSRVCPTIYMEFELGEGVEFKLHDANAMKYANSELAGRKLGQAVRIMAGAALELFLDDQLMKETKRWHRQTFAMSDQIR